VRNVDVLQKKAHASCCIGCKKNVGERFGHFGLRGKMIGFDCGGGLLFSIFNRWACASRSFLARSHLPQAITV